MSGPFEQDVRNTIVEKLKELTLSISTLLINGLFLAVWLAIQFGLELWIGVFPPSQSINHQVLLGFKILFAISTFVPVFLRISKDVLLQFYRIRRRIKEENKASSP